MAVSLIVLTPLGVSAEWRQNSIGWWYTEGNSWTVGWRKIDLNWYYFSKAGYMETGWICDGHNWYYLNPDGKMDNNVVVDGCHLNLSGVCVDFISAHEAKNIMFKEDGIYIDSLLKNSQLVIGDNSMIFILSRHYGINEEVYGFYFQNEGVLGVEFVGVKTGNVYRAGSNGGCPIYLIKNNTIVKQYDWIN